MRAKPGFLGGAQPFIMGAAERSTGRGRAMTTGGCLCGAVRFEVSGKLRDVAVCHCSMCRKWHGAPGPYTDAERRNLRFLRDEGLGWYTSSSFARRGFCKRCGSSLFWERPGAPRLSIAAGAFDDPTPLRTVRHIFTGSKGDWYEIKDGLEQLPGSSQGLAGSIHD